MVITFGHTVKDDSVFTYQNYMSEYQNHFYFYLGIFHNLVSKLNTRNLHSDGRKTV
ncbi:MAG: hypothetical protein ACJA0I_001856 [Gammaproteobacteria bacterium]|jgi:hypothetical protein